ncbi:MAG: methyltransferase [Dokdonella sp.]
MNAVGVRVAANEAMQALSHAIDRIDLALPAAARGLFLGARPGLLRMQSPGDWTCEQSFKPLVDGLEREGLDVGSASDDERYARVFVLPPRQRDESRAMFARAFAHRADDGIVVASVANDAGARSSEQDMRRLCADVQVLSKHKCRVFWSAPRAHVDAALAAEWTKFDAVRAIDSDYVSRPGLFAWDRIDPASRLLVTHLPTTLRGHAADLGAGFGYLACAALRHCPGIESVDLYEADARALEPARTNIERALREHATPVAADVLWHDVTRGLPKRYEVIISNPPFHIGRADQPELGRGFITAAARALEPAGSLWLVANRHLPYEAALAELFKEVRTVVMQGGFKVIHAQGVRR